MSISNKIYGSSKAIWKGGFLKGTGSVKSTSSKSFDIQLETPAPAKNFILRTNKFEENENVTNPEELMTSAISSCFAMTLSSILGKKNFEAILIEAESKLTMEMGSTGFNVKNIHITCQANVPNIDLQQFKELTILAKDACPITKLMKGNIEITLDSNLINNNNKL